MICIVTCGHRPDDERIFGREIKSLLTAGHKITYFTRWEDNCLLSEENLFHRNYSEKGLSVRDFMKKVVKNFMVLKPSTVHIHEFELLPLAKKAKKMFDSKIIYDVHEANIELWDTFSSKPVGLKQIINHSLNQYEKGYLKYVDLVFTTAPELVTRYRERGVKTSFLPNYPIEFPRRSKKNEIPTIIYHGQISIERGLGDLINALPRVSKIDRPFQVKIYGTERVPGTIKQLKELSSKLKLNSIIKFFDQIPHKDMLNELSKAHIAVIPFRDFPMFQIATPVKLFEAMWAKCAIVASDLRALRTIDEQFIEFFPPGDVEALSRAISELLISDEKRQVMANIGEELVQKKYNWNNIEKTLLKAYQELGK